MVTRTSILDIATRRGLLHKFKGRRAIFRTSLYADDAAVFMAPVKQDIDNFALILNHFGKVTGLCTNFQKSLVVPIRCGNVNLDETLSALPAARASFPMKYLGLPLSIRHLKAADFQFLEDKVAARLVPWDGQNITSIGRGALVKSVLTSQVIYHIIALKPPVSTLRNITKIERAFLWAGTNKVTGAKCKVSWNLVCRPTELGGLGILDLTKFARALRLRWLWFEWAEPSKMWVGMANPCDILDRDLFYASSYITIGNGARAPFWDSPWVDGDKPANIAPLIFEASKRKNWTVREAMHEDKWLSSIKLPDHWTMEHIRQIVTLWARLRVIPISEDTEDTITWKHTLDGAYSATSAYKAQLLGTVRSSMHFAVWKAWAPPKMKFLAWLAIQNRIWTADRLQKRGWPNCGLCPLCKQTGETVHHLFYKCRFSTRIWGMIKGWLNLDFINTSVWMTRRSIHDWWINMSGVGVPHRKAIASLTMLTCWTIWCERNARVFQHKSTLPSVLLLNIQREAKLWVMAGAKHLGLIMPGE